MEKGSGVAAQDPYCLLLLSSMALVSGDAVPASKERLGDETAPSLLPSVGTLASSTACRATRERGGHVCLAPDITEHSPS